MEKHTPTPWKYSNKMGGHYHYIVPQIIHRSKPIVQIITTLETFQEDLANAEFIVRAVNSHDDLLEACKGILTALEHEQACHQLRDYTEGFEKAIITVMEAISKAEEAL